MGRYFQHSGWPLGDHEATNAFTVVLGSTFRFHSSGGVHLIIAQVPIFNDTAAVAIMSGRPRLDGDATLFSLLEAQLPVVTGTTLTTLKLVEVPQGRHTLDFEIFGMAAVGDFAVAGLALLAAIEFPSWEASDRIE